MSYEQTPFVLEEGNLKRVKETRPTFAPRFGPCYNLYVQQGYYRNVLFGRFSNNFYIIHFIQIICEQKLFIMKNFYNIFSVSWRVNRIILY